MGAIRRTIPQVDIRVAALNVSQTDTIWLICSKLEELPRQMLTLTLSETRRHRMHVCTHLNVLRLYDTDVLSRSKQEGGI